MLELTIKRSRTARSRLAVEAESAPVAVWPDTDGKPAAYCYRDGDIWHIDLPGTASYSFRDGADRIVADAFPRARIEAIIDRHRRVVVPLALQALGHEVLHASAVSMPCGVVAFCGPSGVGKSTVAWGLGSRGHPVRADDAVALRFTGPIATIVPLPFAPRLSAAAEVALSAAVEAPPPGDEIAGKPLAAIVVLERVAATVAFSPPLRLPPLTAFQELFANGLCFSDYDRGRVALMVERYLGLASTVPVYRASVGRDLDHLSELLDGIEAAFP